MKVSRHDALFEWRSAGALREVDDRPDPRLLGGLGEVDDGTQEAWGDRPDEVSRVDALHGGADGIDLLQVADDDPRRPASPAPRIGRPACEPSPGRRGRVRWTTSQRQRPVSPVAPAIKTLRDIVGILLRP